MKLELKDYINITVILILALSAGVYSAYQYIDGVKKDRKNEETSIKLSKAQEKALKATEEIAFAQKQTIKKTNELVEAQKTITNLQDEIIKQVLGNGYPKLNVINSKGENFDFFIQGNNQYPIFKINIRITDAEKILNCNHKFVNETVEIDKSCYDKSILFTSGGAFDLNGDLMQSISFTHSKKNCYLITEFMCKNIRLVQYSIIKFENNSVNHSYRIYEISKTDNSFLGLLENNNSTISESEYKQHFFFKKVIIVDFAK